MTIYILFNTSNFYTGNVACNTYYNYVEDVAMMKDLGLKHYRFSIAWPRVVPSGKIEDGVNEAALEYYDNLINELINADITPYIVSPILISKIALYYHHPFSRT